MKNLLPFLLLLVGLACQNANQQTVNSTTLPGTNEANSVQSTPKTYSLDLPGQISRITDEGIESQIQQNFTDADRSITYALLKKNAEKYAGKAWVTKGHILEITEKDGFTAARVGVDQWGSDAIYVGGPIETSFVEKDHVLIVGYLAGTHSYTSQANWQITIPAMAIRAMMSPKDESKYTKKKVK